MHAISKKIEMNFFKLTFLYIHDMSAKFQKFFLCLEIQQNIHRKLR